MDKTSNEMKADIEKEASEALESAKSSETEGTPTDVEASDNTETTSDEVTASSTSTDEQTAEEEQWIVPGRFKTVEDLAKGYSNLESAYGRRSSEFKALQNHVQQRTVQETPEQKEARIERFANRLKDDPVEAVREEARAATSHIEARLAAENFEREYYSRKQNPEFNELEPIMAQIAENYGDMIITNGMQNDPRLLDILHYAAKGVKASQMVEEAKKAGEKKGAEIHRKKSKARVEGTSGTKTTKKIDTSKMSAADMKKALMKGDLEF